MPINKRFHGRCFRSILNYGGVILSMDIFVTKYTQRHVCMCTCIHVHSAHYPLQVARTLSGKLGFHGCLDRKPLKSSNSVSLSPNILATCLSDNYISQIYKILSINLCLARTWVYFILVRRSHFLIIIWIYPNFPFPSH